MSAVEQHLQARVIGVEPNYAERELLSHGRRAAFWTTPTSRTAGASRCWVTRPQRCCFRARPMLGETITINGTAFTVIGTVEKISRGNND